MPRPETEGAVASLTHGQRRPHNTLTDSLDAVAHPLDCVHPFLDGPPAGAQENAWRDPPGVPPSRGTRGTAAGANIR